VKRTGSVRELVQIASVLGPNHSGVVHPLVVAIGVVDEVRKEVECNLLGTELLRCDAVASVVEHENKRRLSTDLEHPRLLAVGDWCRTVSHATRPAYEGRLVVVLRRVLSSDPKDPQERCWERKG